MNCNAFVENRHNKSRRARGRSLSRANREGLEDVARKFARNTQGAITLGTYRPQLYDYDDINAWLRDDVTISTRKLCAVAMVKGRGIGEIGLGRPRAPRRCVAFGRRSYSLLLQIPQSARYLLHTPTQSAHDAVQKLPKDGPGTRHATACPLGLMMSDALANCATDAPAGRKACCSMDWFLDGHPLYAPITISLQGMVD